MSWLFKDLINSGLAQFGHAKSNSNKQLKGYKNIKFPHMNSFLSKNN